MSHYAENRKARFNYEILEKYTRALFQRGTEIAAKRGLILVDTKYEFGKDEKGNRRKRKSRTAQRRRGRIC